MKENKDIENIEVVMGDDSGLNISEVGNIANKLRPQDSSKKNKKIIIPTEKKTKK